MTKRAATLLVACAFVLIGTVALAQKNVTLSLKLQRLEGKAQEFLLEATSITIDNPALWTHHDIGGADAPDLEFTSGEPKTLSVELMFDGFEKRDDVQEKFVQPLETLTAIDPQLDRPPMVKVTFPHSPSFTGVVSNVSTKYTMFLPDGTPVRCTTTIQMKKASSASVKKQSSPCP
jgi:hypothetical protein